MRAEIQCLSRMACPGAVEAAIDVRVVGLGGRDGAVAGCVITELFPVGWFRQVSATSCGVVHFVFAFGLRIRVNAVLRHWVSCRFVPSLLHCLRLCDPVPVMLHRSCQVAPSVARFRHRCSRCPEGCWADFCGDPDVTPAASSDDFPPSSPEGVFRFHSSQSGRLGWVSPSGRGTGVRDMRLPGR